MRNWTRAVFVTVALVVAGCSGREERTLNAYGTLMLERGGVQADVLMEGRVYDGQLTPVEFQDAWAAVTRRAAPWDALEITVVNTILEPRGETDLVVAMVLAVPLPLSRGATYTVDGAFAPPTALPVYWNAWGRRDLAQGGVGEAALRVFDYKPVGPEILNDFIATGVTGTIEITTATSEQVILRLDLTATNGAGETLRLTGDLDIRAERYTPPIT